MQVEFQPPSEHIYTRTILSTFFAFLVYKSFGASIVISEKY